MRFSKYAVETFHDEHYHFEIGKGEVLREGNELAVISTGILTSECLKAVNALEAEGRHIRLINMCSIKPIDEALIIKAAQETKAIVTAEEHSVIGGLGSAVAEVVAKNAPVKMAMVGQKDTFGESGKPDQLKEKYGMTAKDIVEAVKSVL
jgi:transketolase